MLSVKKPAALLLFTVLCSAFCFAELPARVTLCELYQNAPKYDKQVVEVRGRVGFGFEDFTLNPVDCKVEDASVYDGWPTVWLEFGGDVEAPITYCCGSHERKQGVDIEVEELRIPIRKDIEFQRFVRLVSAKRKYAPNGKECGESCYFFAVTATITGRFFAGERFDRTDGKHFFQGYGHLGCCSLLVIQSVKDTETQRTNVPGGLKYQCTHNAWKSDLRQCEVSQKLADDPGEEATDVSGVAAADALRQRMEEWHETVPESAGSLRTEYRIAPTALTGNERECGGAFHSASSAWEPYEGVVYTWRTHDQLTTYQVELRRWKHRRTKDLSVWAPVSVERESCTLVK